MISKKAKLMVSVLKKLNLRKRINIVSPKRHKNKPIPKHKYRSESHYIHGHLLMTMYPKEVSHRKHIIYLHGGAYSIEASSSHFDLMNTYLEATGFCVTYIDYPLAPEFNAKDTTDMVFECYKYLLKHEPYQEFILMGDSAGGGLAITLGMMIRDASIKQPIKTLLFSPWLDVSMSNPEIDLYIDKDYILDVNGLKTIGEKYAGDFGVRDYHVSPKYGELHNLGDIGIFYGTEDVLYPDCRDFCNQEAIKGTIISDFKYEGMFHVWIIFSVPEGDDAIKKSIEFITF